MYLINHASVEALITVSKNNANCFG